MNNLLTNASPESTVLQKSRLIDSSKASNFFKKKWGDAILIKESVYLICLDRYKRPVNFSLISEGSDTSVEFKIDKIIKIALLHDANSIIIAHNHPSGNIKPSNEDIICTRRLELVCSTLNIHLDDHIILSPDGRTYSFTDNDLLDNLKKQNRHVYNLIDPDTLEGKVLQLMDLTFEAKSKGYETARIYKQVEKTLDRLYTKYYDPIELNKRSLFE